MFRCLLAHIRTIKLELRKILLNTQRRQQLQERKDLNGSPQDVTLLIQDAEEH